jgi:hypothetical protein
MPAIVKIYDESKIFCELRVGAAGWDDKDMRKGFVAVEE